MRDKNVVFVLSKEIDTSSFFSFDSDISSSFSYELFFEIVLPTHLGRPF